MLVFITTPNHAYTVRPLVRRKTGVDTPPTRATSYDALFQSARTVRGVHVFTDLERLSDWELTMAAELYRALRDAGIVCLNDPARVMARYQLLRNLFESGFNPFTAYRADERPKPARFPVFVRNDSDHLGPLSGLLADQAELDRCLEDLRAQGRPLRGLIVIEFAGEPIQPGVWCKYGTFRIGQHLSVHHAVIGGQWAVKNQSTEHGIEELYEAEKAAVTANTLADAVRPAFDIAGIEWGRADHALFQGRQIVYEINTNPTIKFEAQKSPIRWQTKELARERMARLLWELDSGDGATVRFQPIAQLHRSSLRRYFYRLQPGRP